MIVFGSGGTANLLLSNLIRIPSIEETQLYVSVN